MTVVKLGVKAPTRRLPKLPEIGKKPVPLKVPKHAIAPLGPAIYNRGKKPDLVGLGPGEPPPGFLTAWTSASEWRYYWAIAKIMDDPPNPRQPPFAGGREWKYQWEDPAFGARVPGGQVMDFAVEWADEVVGLRIQTERYHVMAGANQQARDAFLKMHILVVDRVMDLFDQVSIHDLSGAATVAQVKRALRGEVEVDPIKAGTAQRVRAPR